MPNHFLSVQPEFIHTYLSTNVQHFVNYNKSQSKVLAKKEDINRVLSIEYHGLKSCDFDCLAATGVFAAQLVVQPHSVTARLCEARSISLIGARRE
jgi:hypothetical protein